MRQTLFEISGDMSALEEILTETDGNFEDPEVQKIISAWAEESFSNFETKVDNYAALIKTMEARAKVRKEEADRLRGRAKVDESNAANLKQRLQLVFQQRNVRKLETPRFCLSIAKNGGLQALEVDEARIDNLPPECKRITVEADKEAIRKKIEAGEEIPGCKLLPRGESLRIK